MKDLNKFADEIRALTCEMFIARGDGHIGGSFSIVESLSVLFGKHIRNNEDEKDWFVLSKGHSGPSYYATLSLLGHIPYESTKTLNQNGTILPSHPDRIKTPGVDCTTGSLGQGISMAVGIANGLKIQKSNSKVYAIVGDGECNEGQVWEALQFAKRKNLTNLIIIIDDNKKQVDGYTRDVSFNFDFEGIFTKMGFDVKRINGNSITEVDKAISYANQVTDAPCIVLMDTVKGYGIPYFSEMENPHSVTFTKEDIEVLQGFVDEVKGGK